MRRQGALATALVLVGLALAAPAASASGEYEANDTPYTATGPIADGTYHATIETSNDKDYFRIETTAADVQLNVDNTNDGTCDYCPVVLSITDSAGDNLDDNDTYAQPQHGGETDHAGYTLREAGTYYLLVESSHAGLPYHFTVSRAGGGPYEPNDRTSSATGPIADGTYSGVIETGNDQDWFRVDTVNRDVQLSIDMTNDSTCESCSVELAITDSRGDNLDEEGTYAVPQQGGETVHTAYTLHEPGTYFLRITIGGGTAGRPYHFAISRTEGSPVPPPSSGGGGGDDGQACSVARHRVASARAAVRKAKKRYRRHHTAANRRKLNKAKRRLHNALANRDFAC